MKDFYTAGLIFILILLSAQIFGAELKVDYNPSAHFSKYETFNWLPRKGSTIRISKELSANVDVDIEKLDQRIMRSLERQFESKGFQQANSSEADFLVAYSLTDYQAFDTVKTPQSSPSSPPPGHEHWNPFPENQVWFHEHREGRLVLDIVDRGSGEVVWRGTITYVIKPKEIFKRAANATKQLLKKFPPKVK